MKFFLLTVFVLLTPGLCKRRKSKFLQVQTGSNRQFLDKNFTQFSKSSTDQFAVDLQTGKKPMKKLTRKQFA